MAKPTKITPRAKRIEKQVTTEVLPADYLESLMIWIRERPNSYAQHVGELDVALYFLHMAWAKVVNREHELHAAIMSACTNALGVLRGEDRTAHVDLEHKTTRKVLRMWSKVDKKLALRVRVKTWENG